MKAGFFAVTGVLALFSPLNAGGESFLADPCSPGALPEPIRLSALWSEGAAREPGFHATALRVASGELRAASVRREALPTFSLEGLTNYGQRLSPGEERVLGVGPRSELRLVGRWTLLDPGRSGRGVGVDFEVSALRADEIALARSWQADRGMAFAEALWAEGRFHAIERTFQVLEALRNPVEQRVAAGVESRFDAQSLTDALARTARLLDEAIEAWAGARTELSLTVGRCVTTDRAGLDQALAGGELDAGFPDGPSPEIAALRARADALASQARAAANANRWHLSLVGSTGPTRSRAFSPDPIERESLIGLMGSLRLDPAGVYRTQREAGALEARALSAAADQREIEREREYVRLALELQSGEARSTRFAEETRESEQALEAAHLRWRAGVQSWEGVVQAAEQALNRQFLLIDSERDLMVLQLRRLELGLPSHDPLP